MRDIAVRKGATAGQIALAWLLHKGDDIVPIPGTKRRKYLEENVAAADVRLTPDKMATLDARSRWPRWIARNGDDHDIVVASEYAGGAPRDDFRAPGEVVRYDRIRESSSLITQALWSPVISAIV